MGIERKQNPNTHAFNWSGMLGARNADLWVLKGKRQATVLHGQLLLVFLIKLHYIKVFVHFHKVFRFLVWPLHTENTSIWEFACVVVTSAMEISIDTSIWGVASAIEISIVTSIWGFTGALEISLTQTFGGLLVL